MSKLKVCVIGAGAAGLCACRHLASDAAARFSPVVIEQGSVVGGTWVRLTRGSFLGLFLTQLGRRFILTALEKIAMGILFIAACIVN
jgi:flavin-dependent dehydrogenase